MNPGGAPLARLAQLHVLCAQIHRWRCLCAIADELRVRYPELASMLAGLHATDTIRTDIGIRRELADPDIFTGTADFETVPASVRRRWQDCDDRQLTAAYLRYQCAGIAAADLGPSTLAELDSTQRPSHTVIEWGHSSS